MVEATNKLNIKINEAMDYIMKENCSVDKIMNMSTDDLDGMKIVFGIVRDVEDLMFKQAAIIEDQNQKINELLRIVKRMDQK